MQTQPLSIGWRMRRTDETDWIPATVPRSVYGDLLAAGKMQDPFGKTMRTMLSSA